MWLAAMMALVGPQDVSPADKKKLDAARAAVEKAPDDPKANLDLGRILCLFMGEWTEGLPFLAKGGDKSFAPIAEKDLQPRATVEDSLAMADEWLKVEKAQKQYAARLRERALFHYAEAWPKMEAGPSKEALRERVKLMQMKGPESKALGPSPASWSPATGAGVDRQYARSGAASLKVPAPDASRKNTGVGLASEQFPCPPGAKIKYSCWVLSIGGDSFDELRVKCRNQKQGAGEHLSLVPVKTPTDLPIWTKVEGETVAPEGTHNVEIGFKRNGSATGIVFVDDVSLLVNGKEMLKNGGFEK